MILILAFIGVVCILWIGSKVLIKIGNILEGISKEREQQALSAEQLRVAQLKLAREVKKLRKVHGEAEYKNKVQEAIDQLELDINK